MVPLPPASDSILRCSSSASRLMSDRRFLCSFVVGLRPGASSSDHSINLDEQLHSTKAGQAET